MLQYAGIGSRRTPHDVQATMSALAAALAERGWTLRTGGADGADAAFAAGVPDGFSARRLRIHLPWPGYNGISGPSAVLMDRVQQAEAADFVSRYHPAWHRCRQAARKLHARNAAIIHGENLGDPVGAVVCWTPNAVAVGGTATGIHMAEDAGIPVFNLARHSPGETLEALDAVAAAERAQVR